VEVYLPEMTSAKTVELDVEEKKMTLESTEPAEYRLVVNFAYPVDEERGSAKFDRSTRKLLITLPVKAVNSNVIVNRLTSTDSGIDIEFDDDTGNLVDVVKEDTAYRTSVESDSESDENVDQNVDENVDQNVDQSDKEQLLFPTYTCNVYDELMVLKLDVKNVDEDTLTKANLESSEGSGFSIRFTTVGSGMVPMKYGFDMIFLFREEEPGYCLDDLEVEIWDNNVIVQVKKGHVVVRLG
jgi:dynein assembly factor 2